MKTLSRTRGMISKPRLRISLMPGSGKCQGLDDPDQAGLLGGFVELPGQPVGVRGCREKAAITLFPERSDDTLGEKASQSSGVWSMTTESQSPLRAISMAGDIPEIRARRLDFGHRNIGEQLAVAPGLPFAVHVRDRARRRRCRKREILGAGSTAVIVAQPPAPSGQRRLRSNENRKGAKKAHGRQKSR